MKTLERYQCEHCLREYATEEEALACENGHMVKGEIIHSDFNTMFDEEYPCVLDVKYEDGTVFKYLREGYC